MLAVMSPGLTAFLYLLALVLFIVGAVLAMAQRALPLAAVAAGLAAWMLVLCVNAFAAVH